MARTGEAADWNGDARNAEYGGAARIPRRQAQSWEQEAAAWENEAPELSADARRRFRRLERLTWILDRSIPIGGGRIGLDPIIGLLPGAGDFIGSMLSLYILYEGARLGAPRSVLLRMGGNILVETAIGVIPFVGDLFDFVWRANTRNLALLHRHHRADWRPRSLAGVWLTVLVVTLVIVGTFVALAYGLFKLLIPLTGF